MNAILKTVVRAMRLLQTVVQIYTLPVIRKSGVIGPGILVSIKNCRPDGNKPYSFYKSDRMIYEESRNLFQAVFKKAFDTAKIRHNLSINLGYDRFKSQCIDRGLADRHPIRFALASVG
jgi:hypothetical protein